ncbi:MAG: 3-dehydroquinate synthase [Anaerolineae bacterium]
MSLRTVVITGFMGTGKSVVGRLVAERLGRRFVDMDEVLASRAGMPVPEIFARHGEAEFRRQEAALCRELAAQPALVVATGGGALVDAGNRLAMTECTTAVCLTARPAVLWQRVGESVERPMLAAADRRARLEALLSARMPAYREVPHQVDTSDLTEAQAAEAVLAIVRNAERVGEVVLGVHHPGGWYPVFVTRGGLEALGLYLRSRGVAGSVAAITDEHVAALWQQRAAAGLGGHAVTWLASPPGEPHKTLATVERLVGGMVAAQLGRDATVLALGGGVVGDTAGFVSAIYMRGVPFVQAPTTLLAMIDSSVGGKVAVDLPAGKNLVGAFKQPELVVIDLAALETLPDAERRAGLAEVVKAGIIGDADLFAMLAGGDFDLGEVVRRSLRLKIAVVEEDPYERGRRAALNLGHTFGHAYETLSDFRLRHGEAVAIGTVLAARLAAARGLCPPDLPEQVERCLGRLGLPVVPPPERPEAVLAAMRSDKKREAGKLRFVLPVAIGEVRVVSDVGDDEVLSLLAGLAR